jgi:hypothetical protein
MPAVSLVVPINASFTTNGTANVAQIQQESISAQVADIEVEVSHATSDAIFSAFTITDTDSESATASFSVAYASAKAAIKYALANAKIGGAGDSLPELLNAYMKTTVESDLTSQGLYNIVEASLLSAVTLGVTEDAVEEAGATQMDADLTSANGGDLLRKVFTQLPYEEYRDASGGGKTLDDILAVGDSLVFQFTFNSTLTVQPVLQSASAVTDPAATAVEAVQPSFNTGAKSRKINVTIKKSA